MMVPLASGGAESGGSGEQVPPSPSKTKGRRRAYNNDCNYSFSTKNGRDASNRFAKRIYNRITSYLIDLWYNDPALPPLYGPLRFAFYGTVLLILLAQPDGSGALCFKSGSCKRALRRMDHYDNFGFDMKFEAGIMAYALNLMGWDARDVFDAKTSWINCNTMMHGVRYGLGLSAVGLAGNCPRVVAAICWWLMFGIKMISWGPSPGHEQYLAGVGLIALCFANGNLIDGWSFDSVLYKAWARATGRQGWLPPHAAWDGMSPSPGRAARKLVLFQASCVMFFAGVNKFASYGFIWLDGGTILSSLHPGNSARIEFLRSFVVEHSWFFVAPMATVSVIGELLSIFAFISPSWRHIIVASWIQFHIGIMILMHPNFSLQMTAYVLLIDWRGLFGGSRLAKILPFLKDQEKAIFVSKYRSATSQESASSYPWSLRIGALVYSLVATTMFTTSLLRIDFWPFSSYALYNWHSSDPGFDGDPLTPEETISSVSQCFAHPPIGPTCGNKNGSNHHDSIVHSRKHFIKKVIVTGVIENSNKPASEDNCDPDELRIYVNLDPYLCWPRPSDGSHLTAKDIQRIMREATTKKKRKKRPKELAWTDYMRRGLAWRVEDAILASLEDNPRCFEPHGTANPNERNWMAEPSKESIGSDMARRLRSGLTDHNYLPDYPREKVLGVGLFWTYLDGGDLNELGKMEGGMPRACNVGESVLGDLDLAEQEDVGKRFRNYVISHSRDWSQVQRGIVLVLAILGSAFAYSAKLRAKAATVDLPLNENQKMFGF